MDTDELSDLLTGEVRHLRRVLPLSLLCFKSCTQTYSIRRHPVDLESNKILQNIKNDSSLHLETVNSIPIQTQDEVPDLETTKNQIKDGKYLPLNHSFRKHVKPKKQHEILQLGKLINQVCQACGCKHIVDVGAGQGHLSRLLTFGHGLKVTTVEASDCHAPKAEKYDRDMSYSIRSQLKRKLNDIQETSNIDNVSLPDHVTCMIYPNTTPEDFLEIINSQATFPEESLNNCTCQTKDVSCKFSDNAEEICEHRLKIDYNKRLTLTGLHACGDLTPTILRVFARCPDFLGVLSVGCCYMKMSTEESGNKDVGYPMSKFVADLSHHQLSYEAREMACHSIDVYRQRLLDNPPHLKLHCYRAMLQEIILNKKPDFVFGTTKLTIKKSDQMEFEKYAKIALQKLGLDSDIDEELLKTVQDKLSQWKDVVTFYTIRLALAPVVESLILLDRMFYLKEQDIPSYLIPVFDPSISPRNFALVACRT